MSNNEFDVNSIDSVHYFTAAEGIAGEELVISFSDSPPAKAAYTAQAAYSSASDALAALVFCVILLKNGVTFIGQSNCGELTTETLSQGKIDAFENALEKVKAESQKFSESRLKDAQS